ncbi:MAG: 3-deoxy-D-manno-octulosonic acid transferase [Rhodospirillaceae bacterium]|jgi:3-deoxy-D-manno-octulosonic-acid transferase|nr:3-deoxy-D-manno-octulosonic acid transferase [Rhodospirillaceae bacterium]MBT5945252.1 3-deoxy-D-manno-octulosonic acid transferase [Rhodospirillaceae bacterium]MBT6405778.1 3-deoxy-D-manno-octulosonic acid transferase [Rhodospirillaceae bacterium]MBT6535006.1 3-deoxy-D-manno-octulosonic acid transferase [Rhodospirillaceae bacterium]MBT7361491.1 3-deoxy-D-manno-octulosonic acid transferase [Rhodospirillaceae bacterium]
MTGDDRPGNRGTSTFATSLYRGVTTAGLPLVELLLQRRLMRGKEEPSRIDERRGIPSIQRPSGAIIWIHAASIGEAQSVLVLIERILRADPELKILMTTGTVTSARMMGERLPPRAIHQYVPVDRAAWVRRFLEYWRPAAALWVESELWPNLLLESRRAGIPLALVNARMSEHSRASWARAPKIARELLSCFDTILAQDQEIAARLEALGARNVSVTGNLKLAAAPLPATAASLIELQDAIGGRPTWVATSTHRGEEEIVGAVHRGLAGKYPDLLTLLAPRHPQRGDDIEQTLIASGLSVARWSRGETITAETNIYLADGTGLLGQLYRVAPIAFIGGSLIPHGGQNMLEAAQLRCAVLYGPHIDNFRSITSEMQAAGASREVADGDELQQAVGALLASPERADAMAEAAAGAAGRKQEVIDLVMRRLQPVIANAVSSAS